MRAKRRSAAETSPASTLSISREGTSRLPRKRSPGAGVLRKAEPPQDSEKANTMIREIDLEAVRAAAGSTRDPEIRRSLAELGLLDEVQVVDGQVTVHFHLTSPLCPTKFATSIGQEIRKRVEAIPGVRSCEVVLRDHFLHEKIQERINARGSR